jgi:SecD/SecF fusion protein
MTLRGEIQDAAKELGVSLPDFELLNPESLGGSNPFKQWTLRISADPAATKKLLDHLANRFANKPVWPSSSEIGGQVAGRMQNTAIMAIVLSWLGIIAYVWFRFQRVAFGVAAVLALVHDVLVTLAAIALSTWLAKAFGFLLVEEFKVNLTIVAALLTIIGYSINDTIVIFDRIREIRGKSPQFTAELINLSVNQTLARTILTSFTVFMVVIVMYAVGGEGIHGFAYAMLVGTISGAYSTVYIASPALLWLIGTAKPNRSSPA